MGIVDIRKKVGIVQVFAIPKVVIGRVVVQKQSVLFSGAVLGPVHMLALAKSKPSNTAQCSKIFFS